MCKPMFQVCSSLCSDAIVFTTDGQTDGRTDRHSSNVLEFWADQMSSIHRCVRPTLYLLHHSRLYYFKSKLINKYILLIWHKIFAMHFGTFSLNDSNRDCHTHPHMASLSTTQTLHASWLKWQFQRALK